MDELGLRISLLMKITSKKKEHLELIQNITYNQNAIVLGDLSKESRQMFMSLANEKQKMIDEVYNLDIVFQRTYNSIKHLFNNSLSREYKVKLKTLQSIIDCVMDLDKKICELESSNSVLLEKQMKEMKLTNENSKKSNITKDENITPKKIFNQNINNQNILSKNSKVNKRRDARIENANLNKAIAKYNKQNSNYENHKLTK